MRATGSLAVKNPPASHDRESPGAEFTVTSLQGGLPRKGVQRAESSHGLPTDREPTLFDEHPSGEQMIRGDHDVTSIRKKLQELATSDLASMTYERAAEQLGISTRQVSVYTAPTSDKNFPLALCPRWYSVFGKCGPLEWIVEQMGLRVVEPHVAEIGALRIAELEAARRQREVLEGVA